MYTGALLPEQCSGEAQLLFQSKGVSRSRQFCRQYHLGHRQRVITVLDTPRARYYQPPQQPCLSEQSVIEHHIGVKALLLDVERVLALPAEPPAQQCPRCARALTRREWQVLTLLRCQQSVGDIARHLGLSPKTVYTYKRCTMHKLGFTRNTELYHWLINGGWTLRERKLHDCPHTAVYRITLLTLFIYSTFALSGCGGKRPA